LTTKAPELIKALYQEPFLADLLGRLEVDSKEAGNALANWTSVQFQEAVDFFKSKKIMRPADFKKLQDRYKQDAFSIAGTANQYTITQVHSALLNAIETGEPQASVVKEIRRLVPDMSKAHADVVFRNNVIGSYQRGRWDQLQRVKRGRPFWQYVTVGDDRVRPDHAAMDQKVFAADSPVWNTWYPPNGHQCRCGVVSLTQRDVESEGLDVETSPPIVEEKNKPPRVARPDTGWSTSPAASKGADAASRRFYDGAGRVKGLKAPKVAASGDRPFSNSGDLGRSDPDRKKRTVDELGGIDAQKAVELTTVGRFFSSGSLRKLAADQAEARVPIATQFAGSGDQLVRRVASHEAIGDLAKGAKVGGQSSYLPMEASRDRAELVVADGISRGTENVISIVASNSKDLKMLAEVVLQAEAGHGAPVRNAVKAADIVIRGAIKPTKGYRFAHLNHRALGGRREVRLTKKPIKGFTSERVLVTLARFTEL